MVDQKLLRCHITGVDVLRLGLQEERAEMSKYLGCVVALRRGAFS